MHAITPSQANFHDFHAAYLEAIRFTDCGPDYPWMQNAVFAPQAKAAAESECRAFFEANHASLIEAAGMPGYSYAAAGHDFWLTRNRHGTGFWDSLLPQGLRDGFTDLAHACGETATYLGDDGRIHLEREDLVGEMEPTVWVLSQHVVASALRRLGLESRPEFSVLGVFETHADALAAAKNLALELQHNMREERASMEPVTLSPAGENRIVLTTAQDGVLAAFFLHGRSVAQPE
jgi:hypothetical protein